LRSLHYRCGLGRPDLLCLPQIVCRLSSKLRPRQTRFFVSPAVVRIGNVERSVTDPTLLTDEQRRKIPQGYLSSFRNDPVAQTHLQWLLQKDLLHQDCILVGAVGGDAIRRRRLAMAFAELIQQPVELLTVSQDTTESDLKQRRSLQHKRTINNVKFQASITFQDQAPVRAAIHGHLLIIDGLHRAERNVLPTLNNLLENREMPLEDGRLLVSPERYAFLQQQQLADDPINSSLVPIHQNFRVLALLSHDPMQFRRLDPPVRSRFQIRRVDSIPSDVLYDQLLHAEDEWIRSQELSSMRYGTADESAVLQSAKELSLFASVVAATPIVKSPTSSSGTVPSGDVATSLHFPLTSVPLVQRVRNRFPDQPITDLLERVYPYCTSEARLINALKKWPIAVASHEQLRRVYRELNLVSTQHKDGDHGVYDFLRVEIAPNDPNHVQLHFTLQGGNDSHRGTIKVTAPSGGHFSENNLSVSPFVTTAGSKQALTAMFQEHSAGQDILLVSPKGEGKNVIAQHFCAVTGYKIHLFPLYKEMTATDLLLRRTTSTHNSDPHRDWMESPLLTAARTGQVCILDGVDKLSRDNLATLQSLLCDREVTLPDGTKYAQFGTCDVKIQSSFRVIALASIGITAKNSSPPTWLSEDVACMFATVPLPSPSRQCTKQILQPYNILSGSDFDRLLNFHERLLQSAEDCGVSPLSIRTLLRIVKRGNYLDGASLYDHLCSCLLTDLIQPSQRTALNTVLRASRIVERKKTQSEDTELTIDVDEQNNIKIGNLYVKPRKADNLQLVPNPVFVDIPSHVRMLHTLLSEWYLGERSFLLLGNQGTGKNKICDRLCTLLNHEREYIQLHRDSTIGQLTITPSLENGKIVWNDSPLVRAVMYGRALVIDEADKAPLEVIAVLKSLVEDGELLLADGRRILRNTSGKTSGGKRSFLVNFAVRNSCTDLSAFYQTLLFIRTLRCGFSLIVQENCFMGTIFSMKWATAFRLMLSRTQISRVKLCCFRHMHPVLMKSYFIISRLRLMN
jgi:von Willebrand factor A domain-containing protein 8